MFKPINIIASLFAIALISGCSAIQLKPGAARVIATKNPAPKGCKFLGTVTGSQGNFFAGAYTSNRNLAEGSMNDLKNNAHDVGANYVQLETDRAGVTGSMSGSSHGGYSSMSGHTAQTDVTLTGNAYQCDPKEIGLE